MCFSNPNEEDNTVVSISMIDLPKHRYIRKTVKTNMDYMSESTS